MKWLLDLLFIFLQNELEYGADEPPLSPRVPFQNQHAQNAMHLSNLGGPVSSGTFGLATVAQGGRSGQSDNQVKNSVFSNALSSPVRRSIQSYHLAQDGYHSNNTIACGTGPRNNEMNSTHLQNRDTNSPSSNDCMDMHADTPGHEFSYWNYLWGQGIKKKKKERIKWFPCRNFRLVRCIVWSEIL
jgi:hypothetical protein